MATTNPQPGQNTAIDPKKWVDRYGDMLMSYAHARVQSQEVAEDLVQETFLAAWKSFKLFDSRCRFSTWLIAILRHKIADYYRTSGRNVQSLEDQPEAAAQFTRRGKWSNRLKKWVASPDELAQNREFWTVFAKCLADMPPQLSYVFRLRELQSTETKDICRLLDISSSNVAVRLHRARLLLRQCLEMKWF